MGVGIEITYGPYDVVVNGMPQVARRVTQAVERLCRHGEPVTNVDDAVSISRLDDGEVLVLNVRDAEAPRYMINVYVKPFSSAELETRRLKRQQVDQRGPVHSVDFWRTISSGGITWELYNAEVIRLQVDISD